MNPFVPIEIYTLRFLIDYVIINQWFSISFLKR